MSRSVSLFVLSAVAAVLSAPANAQQVNFVLKAACIGGAMNTVTEVAATADGTIRRRRFFNTGTGRGAEWHVLGRDRKRVDQWVRAVDATKMARARVPTTVDRNPCKVGSSRPCHIVRRKGGTDYYACQSQAVLDEMMDFNEWTNKPRAIGALEIVDRWRMAFVAANVDELAKLHAPEALFMGTGSKDIIEGREAIRKYFEDLFRRHKPRDVTSGQSIRALSEDVLIVTGTTASARVVDGQAVPDRVTFVIVRRDGQWLIEHFHSSAMPD
jgi:uncharacterized protein (TIGR02246 family)